MSVYHLLCNVKRLLLFWLNINLIFIHICINKLVFSILYKNILFMSSSTHFYMCRYGFWLSCSRFPQICLDIINNIAIFIRHYLWIHTLEVLLQTLVLRKTKKGYVFNSFILWIQNVGFSIDVYINQKVMFYDIKNWKIDSYYCIQHMFKMLKGLDFIYFQ
jgi:hypothetical protein